MLVGEKLRHEPNYTLPDHSPNYSNESETEVFLPTIMENHVTSSVHAVPDTVPVSTVWNHQMLDREPSANS